MSGPRPEAPTASVGGAARVHVLKVLLLATPVLIALSPLVPSLVQGQLPFPVYGPFVLALILLLSSGGVVPRHRGPASFVVSALGWAAAVTALLGAVAVAWAPSLSDAVREEVAVGVSLWAAWALARALPASPRILQWSLTGWTAVWALVLAGATAEFVRGTPLLTTTQSYLSFSHHLGSSAGYTYVASLLGNPNDLAGFLLTVTPLVLALAVLKSRRHWFVVGIFAFAVACVWSGSRSALGALIPFVIVMLLCRPRTSAPARQRQLGVLGGSLAAAAAVVAVLALSTVVQSAIAHLFAPFGDNVASQDQARAGWSAWAWDQAVRNHAIFGAGPGSFESYASSVGFRTNLHNSLLEIGFQYGLLSMGVVVVALGLVVLTGARAALTSGARQSAAVGALGALSVVGLVVWSFTSSSILMNGFWGLALGNAAGLAVLALARRGRDSLGCEPQNDRRGRALSPGGRTLTTRSH